MRRLLRFLCKRWKALQADSFETFMALICVLGAVPILLAPALAPNPVLALLPLVIIICWAVALLVGGLLDLVGLCTGNLYVRRAGLVLLSAAAFIMGMAAFAVVGLSKVVGVGMYFAFSWACGITYHRLGKELKESRARLQRIVDREE